MQLNKETANLNPRIAKVQHSSFGLLDFAPSCIKIYPERRRIGVINSLFTFKYLMTYSVPLFDISPISNVIGLKNCFQVIITLLINLLNYYI
jgi:hypothetical protein